MTKWLFAFLWFAVAVSSADVATAQDRWARINSATAAASTRQVIVDTSNWVDGCKGIQIAVPDATIAIEHISIVYATGRVQAEKLSPPVRVGPGARSRVFAQVDEARRIQLVTLRFTRVDRSASAATIEVWGLAPSRAPGAGGRPTVQRQFKLESPAPRSAQPPPPPVAAQRTPETAPRRAPEPAPRRSVDASREAERSSPPQPRTRGLAPPVAPSPPPASAPEAAGSDAPPADKPYTEVDIFFGTDRKREADRSKYGRTLADFGTRRSTELTLGKAIVTVPKEGREKGSIPRPTWDLVVTRFSLRESLAQHVTVFAVDVLSRKDFIQQARQKLVGSHRFQGQAFVFVHGYFTTFDDALFRAAQIAHDLEFDGVPFVYSWPSVAGVTGYILDRGRARDARDQLRDFVDLIAKESGATEVHLIAHSMGADPLLEVLRDISRSEPQISQGGKPRFGEIILAAPDVTRESFELIASQIKGLRRGMTLYASANDRALAASRFTRLGESPAGYVPSSGPVVVPGAADTIDISSLDTSFFGVNHSSFADREALLGDMRRLISSGLRPPSTRGPEFHLIQGEGGAYWRYMK